MKRYARAFKANSKAGAEAFNKWLTLHVWLTKASHTQESAKVALVPFRPQGQEEEPPAPLERPEGS
jgi:hypothetical protein